MNGDLMSPGVSAVALERFRQLGPDGHTTAHDDTLTGGELLLMAVAYVFAALGDRHAHDAHVYWPYGNLEGFSPDTEGDPVRDLQRAGALIAAEIDRILRARQATERDPVVRVHRDG